MTSDEYFIRINPSPSTVEKEVTMTRYTTKSWLVEGNRTRGEYGVKPVMHRVSWDPEENDWVEDPSGSSWGAWDPDFGWQAPWPEADVVEDTEPEWRPGPVGW